MATTITAQTIAPVLRAAADRLASLPYAGVNRIDVHHAINLSAPQYDLGQAALDALAAHVPDARWLSCYSPLHSRDEVAAEMRAAADAAERAEAGDWLASADQSFDWTRALDVQVRADLTTCLEIGQRAFRFVRPVVVPVPRGES